MFLDQLYSTKNYKLPYSLRLIGVAACKDTEATETNCWLSYVLTPELDL